MARTSRIPSSKPVEGWGSAATQVMRPVLEGAMGYVGDGLRKWGWLQPAGSVDVLLSKPDAIKIGSIDDPGASVSIEDLKARGAALQGRLDAARALLKSHEI